MKEYVLKYTETGEKFLKILLNSCENGQMVKFKAEFVNGAVFYDPYILALILSEKIELSKDCMLLNSIKIPLAFKDKMPVNEIMYFLTGGKPVWEDDTLGINVKWDEETAVKFWSPALLEVTNGCRTIGDLIIAFRYFKKVNVVNNFPLFVFNLKKKSVNSITKE